MPGIGYAGGYGGAVNGTLIFAGGTNFPAAPPWRNGQKVRHDTIYQLARGDAAWRVVGRLPKPMAGGASVATSAGLLCIGGTDPTTALADVWLLRSTSAGVVAEPYPSLPSPRTACAAAIVGRVVYVVGGHAAHLPLSGEPMHDVVSLDPDRVDASWRTEPPLPGPGRWTPAAATDGRRLFVLSGMVRKAADTPSGPFGI